MVMEKMSEIGFMCQITMSEYGQFLLKRHDDQCIIYDECMNCLIMILRTNFYMHWERMKTV